MKYNWIDNVRWLFSQYDSIQMKVYSKSDFDLDSYEYVKSNARDILLSVQLSGRNDGKSKLGIPLMPINGVPWTLLMISQFEEWIESGCPYGEQISTPIFEYEKIDKFIELSKLITGFNALKRSHAEKVYLRLSAKNLEKEIQKLFDEVDADQALPKDPSEFTDLINTISLIWYTDAFFNELGFPDDAGSFEDNCYIDSLVWKAALAHPMGYSVEGGYYSDGKYNDPGRSYWEHIPKTDGTYTGLGPRSNE